MSKNRLSPADEPFLFIRTLASSFESGHRLHKHQHEWHQLIYAVSGVMTVWTEEGSWVAPPHWAIWVPAGVQHSISFSGVTALRTLYVRPTWRRALRRACGVVTVSPLLRELIVKAIDLNMLDRRDATHRARISSARSRAVRSPAAVE